MTRVHKPSAATPATDAIYQMLAGVAPAGILIADTSGKQIYVNEQAALMTGYSVKELMDGVWMIHPEDTKAWGIFQRAIREGTEGSFYETRLVQQGWQRVLGFRVLAPGQRRA